MNVFAKIRSKSKVPGRLLGLFLLEVSFAYKTAALENCSKTSAQHLFSINNTLVMEFSSPFILKNHFPHIQNRRGPIIFYFSVFLVLPRAEVAIVVLSKLCCLCGKGMPLWLEVQLARWCYRAIMHFFSNEIVRSAVLVADQKLLEQNLLFSSNYII